MEENAFRDIKKLFYEEFGIESEIENSLIL
jgi:hypothetical protein